MNKEKDFFKTCFDTIVGLEVKNESQAIAKEVVLSEIEHLQQQCKKQKEVIDKAMNILKDNFVYDYVRSCDTTDGVGYDEIDTEHFTYRVYKILKEVQENDTERN